MDIDNKVNKGHPAQVDSVLSVEKDAPPNAQSTINCAEGAKVEHIFHKKARLKILLKNNLVEV